ncbi:hypothetical protein ACOME3_004579 [Neoechinorhynchus agilis]
MVRDFTVHRRAVGSIRWPGVTDVRNMNLDEIVSIEHMEIFVYPSGTERPMVGDGLNKPAFVTLHGVFPFDDARNEFVKDPEAIKIMEFPKYVEEQTELMPAQFITYDNLRGTWVFKVNHF